MLSCPPAWESGSVPVLDRLRAITLIRPWPSAILHGPKRVENRSVKPPPVVLELGYIALHAGLAWDRSVGLRGWPWPDGYQAPKSAECPVGIVGVARVLGAYVDDRRRQPELRIIRPTIARETPEEDERIRERLRRLSDDPWFAPRAVGWLLDDPVAIDPVPCRGNLGVWRVPPPVAAEVWRRWKARGEAA